MLLLILLTFVAHYRGLDGDFLRWDDTSHITQNVAIRSINLHNLWVMFTQPIAQLYCPLSWLSFAVDYAMWGRWVPGYHLTNLLLHLANTLLALTIVYRLLTRASSPTTSESPSAINPEWNAALLAAALFGIHPLRVESVAWITERKDVLCGLFYFSALVTYLRWIDHQRRSDYWATFALFTASALSKSAGVTFPVIALILDHLHGQRRSWGEKMPFFLVSAVVVLATVAAQNSGPEPVVIGTDVIPVWARTGLVGYCAFFYLRKFLWPFHLSAVYPQFGEMNWVPVTSLVYLIMLVGVTGLLWGLRRRLPLLWPCWLLYLVTLSPTIGLMPVGVHVVADRYCYIPFLALAVPVAYGLIVTLCSPGTNHWVRNGLVCSAVSLWLALLTFRCAEQTRIWRDTETLFQSVLREHPQCFIAHVKLCSWYRRTGRYDRAIVHGRAAVDLYPTSALGRKNLAWALLECGQSQEAIPVLRALVQRGVDDPEVWLALAECFVTRSEWQNALAALQAASRHPEADQTQLHALGAAAENHKQTPAVAKPSHDSDP